MSRRQGDLPEGGDERLKNMEQVVLKPQNLQKQLRSFADSLPVQGHPSVSDPMTKPYDIDPLPGKIFEAIQTKSALQGIMAAQCTEKKGRIRYRGSIYVPDNDELQLHIIQEHHDTALAGHPGWAKTFDLLDQEYYWKEMRRDVDRYVRNCQDCQRSRSSRHSTFGVLQALPVPEKPWEDISMDFVVGLPECEGFDAIWIVVDRLSKMRHFIPWHTTIDAFGLAELFSWEVVHLYGLPLTIVSDQGPQFTSTFWQQVCSRLGIDRRMSTALHPQTDRQTERMNDSMEQYLQVFINHQQDDWEKWLPLAEFAANNGVSEATKCTPFYAVQGVDPQMLFAGEPTKDQDRQHLDADQVQATMKEIHEHLRVEMRKSQAVRKEGANRTQIPSPNIQEGSQVWLDARHVQTTRHTRRLNWKRLGPFREVRRISAYAYELKLPASIRIHRVQLVSLLDLVVDDPLEGERINPPPPVEVDGQEEYQVSSVVDSRVYWNQLLYLIRWTGYDSLP